MKPYVEEKLHTRGYTLLQKKTLSTHTKLMLKANISHSEHPHTHIPILLNDLLRPVLPLFFFDSDFFYIFIRTQKSQCVVNRTNTTHFLYDDFPSCQRVCRTRCLSIIACVEMRRKLLVCVYAPDKLYYIFGQTVWIVLRKV